ncbi:Hypothetical protein D9617_12g037460 [Elsinoe fawcettii]|nr:Hypothetical protein D9617_12g037460 [Elsinoe fawcettii]
MYGLTLSVLALAGVSMAQSSNGTSSAGTNFAPGYTQSCQGYYDECSRLSGRCQSGLDDCSAKCATVYDACRVGPSANQAQCVANYATCLGKLPAGVNQGGNTNGTAVSGTNNGGSQVVQSLVTVCPYATTLTYNGVLYPATAGQTVTVTNCPCTIGATATPTPAAPKNGTYTPQTFKGAANKAVVGGSGLVAGVLGLAAFL